MAQTVPGHRQDPKSRSLKGVHKKVPFGSQGPKFRDLLLRSSRGASGVMSGLGLGFSTHMLDQTLPGSLLTAGHAVKLTSCNIGALIITIGFGPGILELQ